MSLREQNYWLTTVTMPTTDTARALPETADVVVIGGGFTGLSAARTLAKKGANAVVLEAETIGWGASSRNGGMVLTGMKLGVNKLISMYGRELTQRMYAASLDTIACVEQIVKEEGIECSFTRTGHLEVACKQTHFDDYARQVEVIAREFHHEMRVVQRDDEGHAHERVRMTGTFGTLDRAEPVHRAPPSIPRRHCAKRCCRRALWAIRLGQAASRCGSSSSVGGSPT